MIDVREDHLKIVLDILNKFVPSCEARVFGSRYKWTAKDYSDLDLAIVGKEKIDWKLLADIKEAFQESELPYRVDVLDWNRISEEFKKVIETSGYEVLKKSSGGKVNDDWCLKNLGELTILNYGKGLTAENRKSGKIPVYSSSGITGYHDHALVNEPGIIIGRKGTVGTVFYSTSPFYCIDTAYYIRKSDINFDLKYLYYLIKNLNLNLLNEDSAVPGLNRNTAYSQICYVPNSNTTKLKIANILSSLDDKIELNQKMNETLESMAKAIFKEWFIDFGPVKAKAEGRKPFGMDDETAALFPDSFEESELGLIPKGWRVIALDEMANYLNGLALQKYPPTGRDDLPVVKIAQLRANSTDGADLANKNIPTEYILEDGSVVFSWSGTLEVKIWTGGKGALNQHLFKVSSNKFPKWFYWLSTLQHLDFFKKIAESKATTMGHIQRKHLTEAKVFHPSIEITKKIDKYFSPILEQMILLKIETRKLERIRNILLPKLISGEISLSDV